jgi:hypothetical protein
MTKPLLLTLAILVLASFAGQTAAADPLDAIGDPPIGDGGLTPPQPQIPVPDPPIKPPPIGNVEICPTQTVCIMYYCEGVKITGAQTHLPDPTRPTQPYIEVAVYMGGPGGYGGWCPSTT